MVYSLLLRAAFAPRSATADAIERLVEMIRTAATPPKHRRKTKTSRAAKARRVDEKRRRSVTKRLRGSVGRED